MDSESASLPADVCYRALLARDARFDGCFYTGVTSTGIYCRPVCSVRTPKPENCRFFEHPAQAESAGFRPCLRCRPELAPALFAWSIQDASSILARQAARLIDEPEAWGGVVPTVVEVAHRLGLSDRHLRRIFTAHMGVSPMQYLQTRRLLTAKQLLADTLLPITQVALISGFASVRRFNAAFVDHYGLNPTQLRRAGAPRPGTAQMAGSVVRLGYRPPYDVPAMMSFLKKRLIKTIEFVDDDVQQRTVGRTLCVESAGVIYRGWLTATFDEPRCRVALQVSDSLYDVLPLVIRRVRDMLDLDANPMAINAVLHPHFPDGDGLRVPGALDAYELAIRAVLGQQITVAAARTLAQRLVERFGEHISTPYPALSRLFPAPAVLAQATGDALGQLGIVKQRQAAIAAIASAVHEKRLLLHAGVDVPAIVAQLKALPGIGDWTAQYIAMRALRWPDAFPAGDVALHKALRVQTEKQPARAAEIASQAWRPWRSYAVLRAWARC